MLYSEATAENFCVNARGKKFILLSAHHILNSRNPENCGVVLNPNYSAPERLSILSGEMASSLKVDADLVVLNCCETGVEMPGSSCASQNLANAFLQAGAANVISTLTKVYDKASGELVQKLFRYILGGSSYSRAVRQAKLQFIADNASCPKLWSGFVLNQGAV